MISNDRLDGYLAALNKYDITVDENLIYNSNFQKDETTKVLDFWLSLENPPDAIFTVFYLNAIEMMVEAKKRNIKIPKKKIKVNKRRNFSLKRSENGQFL